MLKIETFDEKKMKCVPKYNKILRTMRSASVRRTFGVTIISVQTIFLYLLPCGPHSRSH